ncbi:MAG: TrbI/VirB10 family protein [Alphaproteobacteria bacterium]
MTNDFDDEALDLQTDTNFDDFDKKKTLGDLWRDNPLVKIGVIVGAAILIFGTILVFGGVGDPTDPSYVGAGSDVSAPPADTEVSPVYREAVEQENEARVEEAQKQGTSALPTPINPATEGLSLPEEEQSAEDPLQRWRQLQEERLARETLQPAVAPEQAADILAAQEQAEADRKAAVEAMADTMSSQMQAILDSRAQRVVGQRSMTGIDWLEQKQEKEAQIAAAAAQQDDLNNNEDRIEVILFPAGEIAYAQLITEANSDAPGPVVAQINSGPLRGSRVLGDFEVQDRTDLLTLNFDTIVVKGISQDIEAVALDPKTTLPAMATEVDHRYLQRIALPMAAAFVEGAASAISESGLTTITINGDTVTSSEEETDSGQEIASGVEEAGQELRGIIDEELEKIQVLVRIEKGTPIGVLFLEPVIDPNSEVQ